MGTAENWPMSLKDEVNNQKNGTIMIKQKKTNINVLAIAAGILISSLLLHAGLFLTGSLAIMALPPRHGKISS